MISGTSAKFSKFEVLSRDGTKIGYLATGEGPGLVLIHGGMATSTTLTSLGESLSDSFSVFIPDRRGRGLSGQSSPDQGLDKDIEDLDALLRETKAQKVFGVSAGATIALQGVLWLPSIAQVALFEPPLIFDGISPISWVPRYEREVSQGELAEAIVTIIKGTAGDHAPRSVLVPRMTQMLKEADARAQQLGIQPMSDLVLTMRRDIRIVQDAGPLERFSSVQSEVLLLGGEKSPRYLKVTLDRLSTVLPNARRVTISGVGHEAATNAGKPELVAVELRRFFG